LLTIENWNDILLLAFRSNVNFALSLIYLTSWIFIGNWIFLNLFLALLLDGFANEEEDDNYELMNENEDIV
jgi:hypothetical protein